MVKKKKGGNGDEEGLVEKPKEGAKRVPMKKLFYKVSCGSLVLLVVGILSSILQGAMIPGFALFFGEMIDSFVDPDSMMDQIRSLLPYFFGIALGSFVFGFIGEACFRTVAVSQMDIIRKEFFKGVMRQEIEWIEQMGSGKIVSRMTSDSFLIQEGISKMAMFFTQLSTFVTALVLAFVKGWLMTLFMLGCLPVLAIVMGLMMKVVGEQGSEGQSTYGNAGQVAGEALQNIRTVAAFSGESNFIDRYAKALQLGKRPEIKRGVAAGLGMGITMAILFAVYAASFRFGVFLVANDVGNYTPGSVLIVMFATIFGAFALGQMGPASQAMAKATGVAYFLFEVIERPSVIQVPEDAIDQGPDHGEGGKKEDSFSIQGVHFHYSSRASFPVLRGLDLSIKAGKTLALVGESGCGKSSILSLLLRFYDPVKGSISFRDSNLCHLDPNWLRKQIGFVAQEPVLFSCSILENIKMGDPEATDERCFDAAKIANAHGFISKFPKKYDTYVGEGGVTLSGGQKQRVAIARAILKNPSVLLLDEATSALDSHSEKLVQKALEKASKDRTTIVVAQRLQTIRNADEIAVISEGKVKEIGSHSDLLDMGGIYSSMIGTTEHSDEGMGDEPPESEAPEDLQVEDSSSALGPIDQIVDQKDVQEEEVSFSFSLFVRLLKLAKPEWIWLAFGLLTTIPLSMTNPAMAIIFAEFLNLFILPPDQMEEDSWLWFGLFLGIAGVVLVFNALQSICYAKAGSEFTTRLRIKTFEAILKNEIGWFDSEAHHSAKLEETLGVDIFVLRELVGVQLGMGLQTILAIIFGLGIAFYHGWLLTLLVLAFLPLVGISEGMHYVLLKGFSGKQSSMLSQVVQEAITNIQTVFAFTLESYMFEKFVDMARKSLRKAKHLAFVGATFTGVPFGVIFGSYAFNFWIGGLLVENGTMDFREMMIVFMSVMIAGSSIGEVANFSRSIPRAMKSCGRIFFYIDRQSSIDPFQKESEGRKRKKRSKKAKDGIEFRSVVFRYPTRREVTVFNNFSLWVPTGKTVALVGASGEGKSTAIALIERFYDSLSGDVLVEGRSVKDIPVRDLRQLLGIVSQEPILFQGTIAENIRFGKEDATDEDVVEAAKSANADKFISSFPDGYDTECGTKGVELSGGQKQRISLARALVRKPKILLLDEATSALDSKGEKQVQKALDHITKSKSMTVLVVAHRLTTVQNADLIAVIKRKRVAELGSHDELIQKRSVYYNLVKEQRGFQIE